MNGPIASEMRGDTSLAPQADVEVPIRISFAEIDRLTRIVERARRSSAPELVSQAFESAEISIENRPSKLAQFARYLIASRRRRESCFEALDFGEPVWDMMLDLYISQVEQRAVSVSSLCMASAVPSTTALRWIAVMEAAGLFVRQRDPADGRRAFLRLSLELAGRVETHLVELRERAAVALR
jgi:DNA-binding MarR family transcriptional regulator